MQRKVTAVYPKSGTYKYIVYGSCKGNSLNGIVQNYETSDGS